VIVSQELKKDQMQDRLLLKGAEEAFCSRIVSGTNCSSFESRIIVEQAKEIFGLGEHSERNNLHDGQSIFFAVDTAAPAGVPIEDCPKRRVVLTHISRAEDLEVHARHGHAAKRRQQILRMAVEVQEQGALLSQEDLSLLLDCDVRTIRSDIRQLQQQEGILVPTRGTVRDIGSGITHKRKAVEMWLSGKEALEVARQLKHSLRAVERYIQTFCRIVYAQRQLRDSLQVALVVGISVAAVNNYLELHQQLAKESAFYRERLEEVLRIGEAHWQAVDVKKSPSPSRRPSGRGME
jgi:hypothetical protein